MKIPETIAQEAEQEIMNYTVVLVGLSQRSGGVPPDLLGSGTLISVGDVYAILTAAHVVESRAYNRCERVGVSIFPKKREGFSIPKEQLKPIIVGYGRTPGVGPDLAAILILSSEDLERIRSSKSFWKLDAHRERALIQRSQNEVDASVLVGAIGEWTKDVEPDKHFAHVRRFKGVFGYGVIGNIRVVSGFDYVDVPVNYDEDTGIPQSFGGTSGGGLWRLRLHRESDGGISVSRPILVGVPYQESDMLSRQRVLTCHYISSLYDSVAKAIRTP